MEPDVIRMFSSSPPPMDDALDEDDEEFGDFGTFSSGGGGVPNSVSFSEFETPTTFNQTQALNATSPPALNHARAVICPAEGGKANGHVGRNDRNAKDAPNSGPNAETLTNGFQGSPTSQKSAPFSQDNEEDFADFAAFSDKAHDSEEAADGTQPGGFGSFEEHNAVQQGTADPNRTEAGFAHFAAFSKDSDGTLDDTQSEPARSRTHPSSPNRTEPGFADFHAFPDDCTLQNHFTGSETAGAVSKDEDGVALYSQTGTTPASEDCGSLNGNASGSVCGSDAASESDGGAENAAAAVNGAAERDRDGGGSETETETSFGRPLSTEALEEFGDMSTTGSVPSPPLQEETATPTGDEEFGDFGDCGGAQDFSSFEQNTPQNTPQNLPQNLPQNAQDHEDEEDDFGDFNSSKSKTDDKTEFSQSDSFGNFSSAAATDEDPPGAQTRSAPDPVAEEDEEVKDEEDFGDFGDFNSPQLQQEAAEEEFPSSQSFGNFSSAAAPEEEEETGWSAFGNEDTRAEEEGESWAAFSSEEVTEVTEVTEEPASTQTTTTASRSERLEQLFFSSFPQIHSPSVDDDTPPLRHLLEPPDSAPPHSLVCVRVWAQLQDIHEALGLRFQWGGSFCNKALLCSLGIDTRNILFTGQKKQPVIVPMYAAGLGMLEPVKPVSAAEMIASIAHNSPCSSESVQEALPPVQFDWSSSGLTNPLDASGGSSLLNLDFFGPVDDSESGAASIPGVDPELFELTTAKMDSSKMTDAFAKLMSSVHSTSTSTARRPRREENLSDEALKVISRFPDLSFMTAKVLMFPTTLTPRGPELGPEPGPESESGPGPAPGPGPGLESTAG